eukprot:CAMPEP_0119333322 /NCGR_PEP_ID=MMETSP1333-20130426/84902_1 /TAXON_ID=418940 /ORGANISM="Scyphosphaera apsteinii, Strain RCC1455" /LENGTH=72 /DNA_ID=CAMNT_0007343363 /DNA_START=301 /DNA_END=519 /DNA_ORIENTATION=-
MITSCVAVDCVDVRLVYRDPVTHAISEALKTDYRVLDEGSRCVSREPAVVLDLEADGQVPVVEGHNGMDAVA